MKFTDWLKDKELHEVGTSTGDVAMFKRPIFGDDMVRRYWPWGEADPFFKKGKFSRWVKENYNEELSSATCDDPAGHSGPSSPLKVVSSSAQTLPQNATPSLEMPIKLKQMKRSKK